MVVSKLQQESLNKAIYFLDFPITYDIVKKICLEVPLTLTPISKIPVGQFQSVPTDKQYTNNMNNFSQCKVTLLSQTKGTTKRPPKSKYKY